jgi:electron transfer flavoprotein beta subunit
VGVSTRWLGREFPRVVNLKVFWHSWQRTGKQYLAEGNVLHICVCVKQTPDSASVYVDPITGQVDYERFVQVLNPADACAVEAAVRLKEALYSRGDPGGRPCATVEVLTLGPEDAEGALRAALAIGADTALRLWNSQAAEWGPFTVAAALAAYLQSETGRPDLILCGDTTSDWSSGIVGPALAQLLDLPQATGVTQLKLREDQITLQVERKLERGYRELLEAGLPLLITVTGDLNEPRYPSLPAQLAALQAKIPVLDPLPLMGDTWLHGSDEMTLLEIHTPRPRPRRISAPDSQHSAYQRIGEIVASGATGRQTRLVEGTPEELAKVLTEFLKAKGFV